MRLEASPGRKPKMPDTPTFGRYAEIPYDQMTPAQQEGYRAMIESRGRLPGPSKIWIHNPKLAKVVRPVFTYRTRARDRCLHHHQQIPLGLSHRRP
jgi:hypothetical protein